MFIELTEVLVCPACRGAEGRTRRPAQGLVVRVDRLEGRRVRRGWLGCPHCEARYPIREGVVRFDREDAPSGDVPSRDAPPPGAAASPEPPPKGAWPEDASVAGEDPAETAILVAALLGLQEGGTGYVLLGRGLAGAAPGLAASVEGIEVVAIGGAAEEGPSGVGGETGVGRVSVLVGLDPARLPLFSGRFRGVALAGGSPAAIEEAGRVLAPRGRLVVLAPSEEARKTVADGPLEVLATEPRAVVAVRP